MRLGPRLHFTARLLSNGRYVQSLNSTEARLIFFQKIGKTLRRKSLQFHFNQSKAQKVHFPLVNNGLRTWIFRSVLDFYDFRGFYKDSNFEIQELIQLFPFEGWLGGIRAFQKGGFMTRPKKLLHFIGYGRKDSLCLSVNQLGIGLIYETRIAVRFFISTRMPCSSSEFLIFISQIHFWSC